jgi:hypothetical protein
VVALEVTVGVIDVLEVVGVHRKQREWTAVALGLSAASPGMLLHVLVKINLSEIITSKMSVQGTG